ncbi:hypothetical protein ABZP36_007399 [Zizania latifolia]
MSELGAAASCEKTGEMSELGAAASCEKAGEMSELEVAASGEKAVVVEMMAVEPHGAGGGGGDGDGGHGRRFNRRRRLMMVTLSMVICQWRLGIGSRSWLLDWWEGIAVGGRERCRESDEKGNALVVRGGHGHLLLSSLLGGLLQRFSIWRLL